MKSYIYIILFLLFTISAFPQEKYPVKGIIIDRTNNSEIGNAAVMLNNKVIAISTERGSFTILSEIDYSGLTVSAMGYTLDTLIINTCLQTKVTELKFYMNPVSIEKMEIPVISRMQDISGKAYELSTSDLKIIPRIGDADPITSVQVLPGIGNSGDLNGQIYLQGGNFDETLIALRGVPVYNPFHCIGITGIFNAEYMFKEELYLSNYPVTFGGRLSGILNVIPEQDSYQKISGSASIGLMTSSATIKSPLPGGSGILAYRRTYLDLVSAIFFKGVIPYSYDDLFGQYKLNLDKSIDVFFSGLITRDRYNIFEDIHRQYVSKNSAPEWGNRLFNILFGYRHSEKLKMELSFYYSESFLNTDFKFGDDKYLQLNRTYVNNQLQDLSANLNVQYYSGTHSMQAGMEYNNISTNYEWDCTNSPLDELYAPIQELLFDYAPVTYKTKAQHAIISSYLMDNIQLSDRLRICPGYRIAYNTTLTDLLLAPYISMQIFPLSDFGITISYGKYYQYLYTQKENRTNSILSPFPVYFLPKTEKEISSANNLSVGFTPLKIFNGLLLELNSYYKKRKGLISSYKYKEDSSVLYLRESGYSVGTDLLLRAEYEKIFGWISYTLSRSVKTNMNYSYFSQFDRTHSLKILLRYMLSEKWHVSVYWTYQSGLPVTPPGGGFIGESMNDLKGLEKYSGHDYTRKLIILDGRKNSYRLDDCHRLDIGFYGSFRWGQMVLEPYLQIFNVYNNNNPIDFTLGQLDQDVNTDEEISSHIIPTLGVSIRF